MNTTNHAIQEEISRLLGALDRGESAPPLARLEETLTSGYARALALEAERLRIERRIGEVAATLDEGSLGERTVVLAELSTRLSEADGELSSLRRLLASLRTWTSELRVAEAGA